MALEALRERLDTGLKLRAALLEALMNGVVTEHREGGCRRQDRDRRRRRHADRRRVTRRGRAASERRKLRDTPAEHAAEDGHVGRDAEHLGSATARQPEPRERLVEHEPSARGLRPLLDALEELGSGRESAELRRDRVEHHGGSVDPDLGHQRLERLDVAPRCDANQPRHLGRDAGESDG